METTVKPKKFGKKILLGALAAVLALLLVLVTAVRSEERRVGKESRL